MKLEITTNGRTQVVQLGTLSAAVNQQITQAVASTTANALAASTNAEAAQASATEATESASTASAAAAAALLVASGITDLGSVTNPVAQTIDLGSLS